MKYGEKSYLSALNFVSKYAINFFVVFSFDDESYNVKRIVIFLVLFIFLWIGVGIVLITVSGIAWRLTSTDAPSCRAMLGLGGGIDGDDCNGRFLTRPNAMAAAAAAVNYGRPQHPYAG